MNTPVNIVPVLDILNGIVVRGIAGKRDQYLPNQSCLVESPDPLLTALAFLKHFQNEWLYVADLDGILHHRPNFEVLKKLAATGVKICADIGVRKLSDVEQLFEVGCARCVIALETLPNFEWLATLVMQCDPTQLTFSLDLKSGIPLHGKLSQTPPLEIAQHVHELGISHLIVLDLASVGTNMGISTIQLCKSIKTTCPNLTLWTGGGIRNSQDIQNLDPTQLNGLLIASALHDGRIV